MDDGSRAAGVLSCLWRCAEMMDDGNKQAFFSLATARDNRVRLLDESERRTLLLPASRL
jgi:hypothetical protein